MSRPLQASHVFDVYKIREKAIKEAEQPPMYENPLRPNARTPTRAQQEPEPEPDFNDFIEMIVENRPKVGKVRKVFREYVEELNEDAEIF